VSALLLSNSRFTRQEGTKEHASQRSIVRFMSSHRQL
jgi:hypothetical protein